MSLFAVLSVTENQKLIAAIKEKFPDPDNYQITPTQWIVSARGTAKQVSDTLGVSVKESPVGSAVILAISGYWGRANTDLWDWMKAKMEEGSNG
jgi:hypothetical protein